MNNICLLQPTQQNMIINSNIAQKVSEITILTSQIGPGQCQGEGGQGSQGDQSGQGVHGSQGGRGGQGHGQGLEWLSDSKF